MAIPTFQWSDAASFIASPETIRSGRAFILLRLACERNKRRSSKASGNETALRLGNEYKFDLSLSRNSSSANTKRLDIYAGSKVSCQLNAQRATSPCVLRRETQRNVCYAARTARSR